MFSVEIDVCFVVGRWQPKLTSSAEADAPILAANWMIVPRHASITAPLSEQTI
jgi:hypothetical protein